MIDFTLSIGKAQIPVSQKGTGKRPLLLVGPASLFTKPGLFPEELFSMFTVYFADIFSSKNRVDNKPTNLEYFVDLVDTIRRQLNLDKPSIFAHSAMGVLGYEYSRKYPEHVSNLILVSTAPIWQKEFKDRESRLFFEANASDAKKEVYASDQAHLSDFFSRSNVQKPKRLIEAPSPNTIVDERQPKFRILRDCIPTRLPDSGVFDKVLAFNNILLSWATHTSNAYAGFVLNYLARRSHFLFDLGSGFLTKMWADTSFNSDRITEYFTAIDGYDFRDADLPSVPIFLGLGLHDASAPYYLWTDECDKTFQKMTSHIFEDSGHFPMTEQKDDFYKQLEQFINDENVGSLAKQSEYSAELKLTGAGLLDSLRQFSQVSLN